MALQLDHVFILTTPGAPAADRLLELGWVEGNANRHPGQGTSNRRFFLPDFTVELLFISDADEAAQGAGNGLRLLARSQDDKACPFGVVVRVADGESAPDFPAWQYVPDYFDGKMCFYVGDNSDRLEEPLCICMPPSLPQRSPVPEKYQNPTWNLHRLDISLPIETPSVVLQQFAAMDKVNIVYGEAPRMTLNFNKGAANVMIDLSPELPLVINHQRFS
ncbi:MAG: hypothetical protein AB8B97_04435 [Granulosicoccus sp.]